MREETGLECELGAFVGSTFYEPDGTEKEVRWWRMSSSGEPHATDEVDAVRWATPAEASALLSYDGERALVSDLR